MIRVLAAMLGLAAWLAVSLGLRAYHGGKAYAAQVLGSESLAEQAMTRMLQSGEAVLLGMDPWTLLGAASLVLSGVFVLGLLWPVELVLRRLRLAPGVRVALALGLAAGATAAVLLSIHPLLSMPQVPEGPRTVLNYACEAAGYGWINAIAYLGALVTAAAFVGAPRGAPAEAAVTSSGAAPHQGQAPVDEAEGAGAPAEADKTRAGAEALADLTGREPPTSGADGT